MGGFRTSETRDVCFEALNAFPSLIIWDTETSGLNPEKDFLVQLSAVKCAVDFEKGNLTVTDTFNRYLNWGPQCIMDGTKASECNGITDAMLAEAPPAEEVVAEWREFIKGESVFAGYNSNFDIGFTSAMQERCGFPSFKPMIHLDVLKMCRDVIEKGQTENYKLGTVVNFFGCDDGLNFHDSSEDVEATRRVFECVLELYKQQGTVSKGTIVPTIYRLSYWAGYRGFSRIYVITNCGEFYYDIRNKRWCMQEKPENMYKEEEIDMEALRSAALAKAGVTTDEEFARYR